MIRAHMSMLFGACLLFAPRAASAQSWNDPRTLALVEQATQRRARQIADTALASYQASAHGYLTFLAPLGEGFTESTKMGQVDARALGVKWKASNLSKRWVDGRRETVV